MPVALFSTAILSSVLGSWVFLSKPTKRLNITFFALALSVSGWATVIGLSAISFNQGAPRDLFSIGLGYLFGCALLYSFYLTCRELYGKPASKTSYNYLALAGCLLCVYLGFHGSIVKSLAISDNAHYYKFNIGWAFPIFVVYVLGVAFLSAKEIASKYLRASDKTTKLHLFYFSIATGTTLVFCLVCNVLLPNFGISSLSPYGAASPLISIVFLAVAITRHNLLSIRVPFRLTTTITIWVVALWVPLAVYLALSHNSALESAFFKYGALFGLTIWIAILYAICRNDEKTLLNPFFEHSITVPSQKKALGINLESDRDQLRDLVEAMIHDLSSRLTLTVIDLKRSGTPRRGQLIGDLRGALETLRNVSRLLECDDFCQTITDCDLRVIVSDIVDEKLAHIGYIRISTRYRISSNVLADPVALGHILSIVIDNALKYVGDKPKPHVEISAVAHASEVEIIVSDNGIGIAEKDLGRIMEPLRRGSRQIVGGRRVEGSGIGLAIANRLLRKMGGRMFISSEVGVGTRTRVFLPAYETAANHARNND